MCGYAYSQAYFCRAVPGTNVTCSHDIVGVIRSTLEIMQACTNIYVVLLCREWGLPVCMQLLKSAC